MDITQRIAQFENMVQADPENDMAHYSLGNAYGQAERHMDAAESFTRCTQLNPSFSKAYQLAGQHFMSAGELSKATEILTEGYKVASEKGDLMPKKAMAELLTKMGQPLPEVKSAPAAAAAAPAGSFVCRQTGEAGTQLPKPPFKGPVGRWIYENISAQTWDAWIRQGTKVINELRLDLSREQDSDTYDRHMREYLGIDDALLEKLESGTAAGKN